MLLIEDHPAIAVAVGEYLENVGYSVDFATDGPSGLDLANAGDYDAIILDMSVPRIDGIPLCKHLRTGANYATPIMMLSAGGTLDDRLTGITAGSDDYLTKPFEPAELDARLGAMIRRSKADAGVEIYRVEELTLDTSTMTAVRAGQVLTLTMTELRLLQILMRASPAVVSKRDMARQLWEPSCWRTTPCGATFII